MKGKDIRGYPYRGYPPTTRPDHSTGNSDPHPGRSFPLFLCGSIPSTRAIARIDTGKAGTSLYHVIDYSSRSLILPWRISLQHYLNFEWRSCLIIPNRHNPSDWFRTN